MWETVIAIARIATAIITGVVGPILLWWIKNHYYTEDEEKEEEKETEKTLEMKAELEEIRKETKADRIWISQFHNGGKFIESVDTASMKKMSVVYEKTKAGVSKEKDSFSNVMVSFFSEMIQRIIDAGHVEYGGADMDVDPEAELLFRQRGTERMHLFAMKDMEGSLIGIMGVDYTTQDRKLEEDEIQYLTVKANLLAGYIYYMKIE